MLPIVALICATLFAGAAIYISVVEHPARLRLENGPALAHWKPSYSKALPIQSGLAIAGGIAGCVAFYRTGDWRWFAGSVALLANWPFTLIAIMPTNKRLKASDGGMEVRALLTSWGKLHNVRSVLGAAAAVLFATACLQ